MSKYDFSGWATVNDIRCADGRTIRKGAFKHCSGHEVPLVWQHQHNDPDNVLGHAMLEERAEGIYAYCAFNNTEKAATARELVQHGDITSLSIYANGLKQNSNGEVFHGNIRELSLVLAGANPYAFIDCPVLEHGEDSDNMSAYVCMLAPISSDPVEVDDVIKHAESDDEGEKKMAENNQNEKTVKDVFDTFTDEQKKVVYYLVGMAAQGEDAEHSAMDNEEDDSMAHNVFENDTQENTLTHDEIMAVLSDAKRYGSLKESCLQHGLIEKVNDHIELAHGIIGIETLFPEATNLNNPPEWIKREDDWVAEFMNAVHKSPFSRIKSSFADITEDDARAKGFLPDRTHRDAKGNLVDAEGNPAYKKEEVFTLLKRTTTPTTVYKKQKLDRDDIIDITDFDVVAWLKEEMRMMWREEVARAMLVSDGRAASSDDKINELNIRPIWKDDDFYSKKQLITLAGTETEDDVAKLMIRAAVKGRKGYKGSGNPTLFTTEDYLTNMMLLEDSTGRRLYNSEAELAKAMRVNKIVTVPVMENLSRQDDEGKTRKLLGIIVNPKDYNLGADKGGQATMFDDFDIDYNTQKYLYEGRCSGALVKPMSAIVLESTVASA